MKHLIFRCVAFILLLCTLFFLVFFVLEKNVDAKRECYLFGTEVFVWGDSDIYRGMMLDLFSKGTGKVCKSSAYEGAGCYDFLVFAHEVPPKSTCFVGFSDWCFMKEMHLDGNRAGLSSKPFYSLVKLGWDPKSLWMIAKENRFRPSVNFQYCHTTYPDLDTMVVSGSIDSWSKFFDNSDSYIDKKFLSYELGIKELAEKNCKIIAVMFPICTELENAVRCSRNREKENELKARMVEEYDMKVHDLVLQDDRLLMYDWFHLNNRGAELATQSLIDMNLIDGHNHFVTIAI